MSATTEKDVTVTPQQRLTILKHLVGGKDVDVVATIVSLPRERVFTIARGSGHPNVETMKRAIGVLENKIRDDEQASIPRRTERPAAAAPSTAIRVPTEPATKPDELQVLLNDAKAHPSKRIQRQADKVFDAVAHLRDLIREDHEKNAAKRKAEAEKAAARAEVEKLERELAEARAKLRGTSQTAVTSGADSKAVRAWAAENGVPCPPVGRVPASVREAYEAAHAG